MADTNTSTTKECKKCFTDKLIAEFHKDKSRKDGVFPWCRACARADQKRIYAENIEKARSSRKADYQKNKEAYKLRAKKWAEENPGKRKVVAKKYLVVNPEKRQETQKQNRIKNPGLYAAHYKMRQTRKRKAMPAWADIEAIKAIYRQCAFASRVSGVKYHVDHFYPLKSDLVCGLHNHYNLRIVPAAVNLSKGNSFPE